MRTPISINHRADCHDTRPAFTIIEMLMVIAIVMTLTALLIPFLGKAFDHSRELGSSANLRSIGQIYELYLQDSQGLYPSAANGATYPLPQNHEIQMTLSHWEVTRYWNLLFERKYPWKKNANLYLSPGAERDLTMRHVMSPIFPSYEYSASFLGHPRLWSGSDISQEEWALLEKSARQSMVRYPSSKVLMWDVELPTIRRDLQRDDYGNLSEVTPMLFADQHVESHMPSAANPGVVNPITHAVNRYPFLHNTRDGVYGRDY